MAIFLTFSFIYNVCFAMFAELIYSTMEKIAVFPGSFDPFTVGHEEIVRRGLKFPLRRNFSIRIVVFV